jgi:hypothetical protein
MTPKLPLDFKESARNQNGFIGRTDQLDERGDVRPSEFLADICYRPVKLTRRRQSNEHVSVACS